MNQNETHAPGGPGIEARWTSSAKSGIGTSFYSSSRVWFTLSHGILNEVYATRIDVASIRDLGFIVTDGREFFSEEKRHTEHEIEYLAEGVPGYRLRNRCEAGRYVILKEVVADPERPVVLQQVAFGSEATSDRGELRLFVLLAPHLINHGAGNTAWIGEYKGIPVLYARRGAAALALVSSAPWVARSAGFVGRSDGWQELVQHKQLVHCYDRAENGNVALTGEIDLAACDNRFVLALAFGHTPHEAAHHAVAALERPFATVKERYIDEWQAWHKTLEPLERAGASLGNLYRTSMAVIRAHEAKDFQGGIIASLSIPWGFAMGDDDLGGYHLVWPRDLVQSASALLAAGAHDDARRVLSYLRATQEADGSWPQNMWLDGTPYWKGIQMDETALPIMLVDLAWRERALSDDDLEQFWPMVRRAAAFLVQYGPITPEDRWEENSGYSTGTLAVEIAALVVAADLAERHGAAGLAHYLRETADGWHDNIDRWTYATGTPLCRQIGVDGYYVRIAPPECREGLLRDSRVHIQNQPPGQDFARAIDIVSADALLLVRFGLRAANDPRLLNTVKVIDALLKCDFPFGPCWHRYNHDGYGEHTDGSPFDGTGIGRAWPLLSGERAHYELAAGRTAEAEHLCRAIEGFANQDGLLPEQVWDAGDIPDKELRYGRPAGSAMPLVWAHAEYVRLLRSLRDGRVFDLPPQVVERYQQQPRRTVYFAWRFTQPCRTIPAGKILRLELFAPAAAHWSADGWQTTHDTTSRDTGLGLHVIDLPTQDLPQGARLLFTFFWTEARRWEGNDFTVAVE